MSELFRTLLFIAAFLGMLLMPGPVSITIAACFVLVALAVIVPSIMSKEVQRIVFANKWPIGTIFLEIGVDFLVIGALLSTGQPISAALYALYTVLWGSVITYTRLR